MSVDINMATTQRMLEQRGQNRAYALFASAIAPSHGFISPSKLPALVSDISALIRELLLPLNQRFPSTLLVYALCVVINACNIPLEM